MVWFFWTLGWVHLWDMRGRGSVGCLVDPGSVLLHGWGLATFRLISDVSLGRLDSPPRDSLPSEGILGPFTW
jgi:hypothetical protein